MWQPILLGALFKIHGRDSWANGPEREDGMREVERRAAEYGLPPVQVARSVARQHAVRDAGRDVRDADRQGGVVLAGRVPAGVRRRAAT